MSHCQSQVYFYEETLLDTSVAIDFNVEISVAGNYITIQNNYINTKVDSTNNKF